MSQEIRKTMWSSPAGKTKIADRIVKLFPAHKTYVEAFAGSAALLFAKEPSDVEAINDADEEIAFAFRTLKSLSSAQLDQLKAKKWEGDMALFKRLHASKPTAPIERLYRFLYLSRFSFRKTRGATFDTDYLGKTARTPARVEKHAPRLAKVHVHSGDYEAVIRKYDGAGTFFFLDPPYSGHNASVGESAFDEVRFLKILKSIKGKWLLTYGMRGKLPEMLKAAGYKIKQFTSRSWFHHGHNGPGLKQLIASNFDLVGKSEDSDWLEEGSFMAPKMVALCGSPFAIELAHAFESAGAVPVLGVGYSEDVAKLYSAQRGTVPVLADSLPAKQIGDVVGTVDVVVGSVTKKSEIDHAIATVAELCPGVFCIEGAAATSLAKLQCAGYGLRRGHVDGRPYVTGVFGGMAPDLSGCVCQIGKLLLPGLSSPGKLDLAEDFKALAKALLPVGSDLSPGAPHDQCMKCETPPDFDLLCADGDIRAWFCADHFNAFRVEPDQAIVKSLRVWGEVGDRFGDVGA